MDSIKDPTTKAVWFKMVQIFALAKKNQKEMDSSNTIAKFAFGVGITSLAASLISLGVSWLKYGT